MPHVKRNLYYVKPEIRSIITKRIAFYWCACVLFSTLPLIIGTSLVESDVLFVDHLGELAKRYWPLHVILFGLLPFAIKDSMRIVNRTLGPLDRLRRELARYRETGQYTPVTCRHDDLLGELILEINDAIENQSARNDRLELSETDA